MTIKADPTECFEYDEDEKCCTVLCQLSDHVDDRQVGWCTKGKTNCCAVCDEFDACDDHCDDVIVIEGVRLIV